MRFCDKLTKLRKENNLSQEQFADKMNVSRQAVSKWESGSSYPDMDKIISMCKVLNCNLEDILDDGVIGNNSKETKINLNIFKEILDFITKSYNMFWSMKFKEKIKCLFELFVIFLTLLIFGIIIYSIFNSYVFNNLRFTRGFNLIFKYAIDPIFTIMLLVFGIIIFIHLFKIRYLDYFITIEDNDVLEKTLENEIKDEKIINNKRYVIEKEKPKIIIRDPKHSTFSFINKLGKILLIIIKLFVLTFIIPFVFFTLFLITISTISFAHIKYGLLFLFIGLAIIGLIIICFIIINFAYNFIFNRNIRFKLMFNLFIISLIMIGVSSGISFICLTKYDYNSSSNKVEIKEEKIKMNDNIIIFSEYNVNYIIDDGMNDIDVKLTIPKGSNSYIYLNKSGKYDIYHIHYLGFDGIDGYKYLIEDLKDKKISNFSKTIKIDVILSQKNYDILHQNEENYY